MRLYTVRRVENENCANEKITILAAGVSMIFANATTNAAKDCDHKSGNASRQYFIDDFDIDDVESVK